MKSQRDFLTKDCCHHLKCYRLLFINGVCLENGKELWKVNNNGIKQTPCFLQMPLSPNTPSNTPFLIGCLKKQGRYFSSSHVKSYKSLLCIFLPEG